MVLRFRRHPETVQPEKRTLYLTVERRLTQKQNFAYLDSKAHFILVLVNLFLQQFDQEIEDTLWSVKACPATLDR